jgi:hypothetical protein
MSPIIQVRSRLAKGLPKTCYWGGPHTLFWPYTGDGCFLLSGNMQFSDVQRGICMCCQSLGLCCREVGSVLIIMFARLPFRELVGWCQPGGLRDVSSGNLHHILSQIGFYLCSLSGARTRGFERRFNSYHSQLQVMSKRPAVEIWLGQKRRPRSRSRSRGFEKSQKMQTR